MQSWLWRALMLEVLVQGFCYWTGTLCDCTQDTTALCASNGEECKSGISNCYRDATWFCKCAWGYYQSNQSCLPCGSNPTWDSSNTSCYCTCSSSCGKCQTTPSHCTACYPGAQVTGTNTCQCIAIPAENPQACTVSTCHATCATCAGTGANQCNTCVTGLTLAGTAPNSCECTGSFYLSGTSCAPCDSSCATCDGGTSSSCLSCASGTLAGSAPNSCSICDSHCSTCAGAGANQCLTCTSGLSPVGGSTPTTCECPSNSYFNTMTPGCSPCNSSCVTCSGPGSNDCMSCDTDEALAAAAPNSCIPCNSSCVTCNGPGVNDCMSCDTGAGKVLTGAAPNSCTSCDATCATCSGTGGGNCVTCTTGLTPTNTPPTTCKCSSTTYFNTMSPGCSPCDLSCATCNESTSSDCLSCHPGKGLSGTPPNSCALCDPTCSTCSGIGGSDCMTCTVTLSPSGTPPTTCGCTGSTYPTPTPACLPCESSCLTCSGPLLSDCLSCHPGVSLQGAPPNLCLSCHITCGFCVGTNANECRTCASGLSLQGTPPTTCVCPSEFYLASGSTCAPCHSTCATCSGPSSNHCLACPYNSALTTTHTCACIPPVTLASVPPDCFPCHSTCVTCLANSDTSCLTCHSNANVLVPPGPCDCIATYYPATDSAHCEMCSAVCYDCDGPGDTQCVSCKVNAELQGNQCICKEGYQGSPDASNCLIYIPPADVIYSLSASLQVLANNSLILNFNDTLQTELPNSEVNINVTDASNSPLSVEWTLTPLISAISYGLNLTFALVLPDEGSQVLLLFPHPSQVESRNGAVLSTSRLTGLLHAMDKVANESQASQMKSVASQSAQSVITVSAMSSVFSGSPSSFWSLFNQLQLITYIPLSNIPLSTNFASTLMALNMNSYLTNPFSYVFTSSNCTEIPEYAAKYGLDSSLFLLNSGVMVSAAVVCVVSCIQTYLLSRCNLGWLQPYLHRLLVSYKWGVFVRYWVQVYMDISLYSLLQLHTISHTHCLSSPGFLLNVTISVLLAVISLATPFILLTFTLKNKAKMMNQSDYDFNHTWGTLFLELHPNSTVSTVLFYTIYFFRRLIYSFLLVFLSDSPGTQAFFMLFAQSFV